MNYATDISAGRSPGLLTRGFVALLLTQSSFAFGFSTFFLLPKYLATNLDATAAQIGQVMGVFGVSAVVLILLVGVWVDRTRRRRFMTAGSLLMALSSLGFLWVESVGPLIFALRILQGCAFALMFIAASTLVTDQAPPERLGRALGLFGVATLSMHAIAPAIVERTAESNGWGPVFMLAGASCLIACVLSRFVPENRVSPGAEDEVPGLGTALRRQGVLRMALIVALVGNAFGTMFTFHQPFALELGIEHVRGFFVSYAVAALLVRMFLGGLADRTGRRRVSSLSLVLYGVVVLWMTQLTPGLLEWIGVAFGFAHGLLYPALNAIAVEGAGEHERGKVMAIYNASFNLGFAGGITLLGALAERVGYPPIFVLAGAGCFLALILLVTGAGSPARSR